MESAEEMEENALKCLPLQTGLTPTDLLSVIFALSLRVICKVFLQRETAKIFRMPKHIMGLMSAAAVWLILGAI